MELFSYASVCVSHLRLRIRIDVYTAVHWGMNVDFFFSYNVFMPKGAKSVYFVPKMLEKVAKTLHENTRSRSHKLQV